ncbi:MULTISPECIES: hypothetical protein [Bacillaceae]|uniref:hypothetical protein n=1 Tax=Bacillaceae TaxID=186817 RepID=UPI000BFCF0ED|nr:MULTISPECIES: hypothetical protein [Bacillaceae]PGT83468.1 hypothetical protein COD11_12720 [Bacillus sp. AFS040349]UGB31354.1 hypothetical protein LPC09_02140 [Metabacillus sp. B2-18]UGB33633.1 hypothetical protein LPC09_27245 [Metabacillus sp. B2-18]
MSMIINGSRAKELESGLDKLQAKLKVLSDNSKGEKKELLNRIISTAVKQNQETEANNEGANHLARYYKPMSTHDQLKLKLKFNDLINVVEMPAN